MGVRMETRTGIGEQDWVLREAWGMGCSSQGVDSDSGEGTKEYVVVQLASQKLKKCVTS